MIEDEELLCVGSFNWFSAAREDKYQRYDTSLVYRGEGVKNEIKAIYGSCINVSFNDEPFMIQE
ncbi:hypothetical protein ACLK1S_26870 [Escherichia coli]